MLKWVGLAFQERVDNLRKLGIHLKGPGSLVVKVVALVISFGTAVVLARLFGPAVYGGYVFIITLVHFLSFPFQQALPTLVVREAAKDTSTATERPGNSRDLLRSADHLAIIFSLGLIIIIFLLYQLPAIQPALGITPVELYLIFLLIPLLSLVRVREGLLQGKGMVVVGQVPTQLLLPIVVLITAVLLGMVSERTKSSDLVVLYALAAVAALGSAAMLRRTLTPDPPRDPHGGVRWLFRAMVPLAVVEGLYLLNSQTSILMLGLIADREMVGVFRTAVVGAGLVPMALAALNTVAAPEITRLTQLGDSSRLEELLRTLSGWVLVLSLPVAAVLFTGAGPLLRLAFGELFTPAALPLRILLVGQVVNIAVGPVALLLNMTGNERAAIIGLGAGAAINVTLNGLLIPAWGTAGAAVATVLSLTTWNALLLIAVVQRLNVAPSFLLAPLRRGD